MSFVLRQIHPPGRSALADQADLLALTMATVEGTVQMGPYLEWSDPNARFGLGHDIWTDDISKAKRFASFKDAMACWKAQSTLVPLRPDGKPNRPMTAFSVTVEEVPDEAT